MQWGDVPSWVGAVGSAGALIVATILFWISVMDRKRKQASQVNAWQVKIIPTHAFPEIHYKITNSSDEPVYAVVLKSMCGVEGTFISSLGTIGPKEEKYKKIFLGGSPRAEQYQPEISFRDAAGRIWLREENGKLKQISAQEVVTIFRQDAGAYQSLEAHPTMSSNG
jgi:hypothetical protein